MKPYYDQDGITLYHGDCMEVLPTLEVPSSCAVVTDPPYLTGEACAPIRGRGVSERISDSESIGNPWGYSTDWIGPCLRLNPQHWFVFANYKMLAGLCYLLEPSCVFVWRKSNAPRMTRPVPRLDCEFIIWSRSGACDRMGEFKSMVLDVPMPQAGCMAGERIIKPGSGSAAHPCQKPMAVVRPFIQRIDAEVILDPFAGSGTTLVAAKLCGRRAVGIEVCEKYCEIAAQRLAQGVLFGAGVP